MRDAPHQSLPCVKGGGTAQAVTEGLCGRYSFYCGGLAKSNCSNNPSVSFADSSLIRGSLEALPRQLRKPEFGEHCGIEFAEMIVLLLQDAFAETF